MQGDYQRETVYGDDPAAMARRWVGEGARHLHLVDLDGARDGRLINRDAVSAIARAVDIPVELGGGIRDEATIAELLELGLSRVVVGTKALREPDWLRAMCKQFPQRIVLGIDAREGRVATHGWLETSNTSAVELAKQLSDLPLAALIYTDIATDGMLAGPNLGAMREMASAVKLPVIASGGVTTVKDVEDLVGTGVAGCIIGRALYEHKLALADAIEAVEKLEAVRK
jgi:phosphoribosylformimino-5-aminoimidazole carboxamide ribotide isomerase